MNKPAFENRIPGKFNQQSTKTIKPVDAAER